MAIPDRVLDAPIPEAPSVCIDTFANSKYLLPPPYTQTEAEEEEIVYA